MLQGYSEFVSGVMEKWKVPGAAIAIVRDGEICFAEGFGLRDRESGLKVTPSTLFAIGSCTKAMTCMAISTLVDEGKLDWNKPVRSYLPSFTMYDPYVTERMTPLDLVTHRSGLPRHDAVWYQSRFTSKELFDRLRYLEPSHGFRETYQYQNLMYMAAGYLAGEVAGCGWERLVRERILTPLGMSGSIFSVVDMQESSDFARPYQKLGGEVRSIPFYFMDGIGPAGGVNSSAADMARWVLLQLNGGKAGVAPVVSEDQRAFLHSPQIVVSGPVNYAERSHSAYGLGWRLQTYRGEMLLSHGGEIDGFSAMTSFMPSRKAGVVVLTNLDENPLPFIASCAAYDRILGLDPVPWNDRCREEAEKAEEAAKKAKEEAQAERQAASGPSHPREEYSGEYDHPGYGRITVSIEGGDLRATMNGKENYSMIPLHYDVFEFTHLPWGKTMKGIFSTDSAGAIHRLALPFEPAVGEIVFSRAAPAGENENAGRS